MIGTVGASLEATGSVVVTQLEVAAHFVASVNEVIGLNGALPQPTKVVHLVVPVVAPHFEGAGPAPQLGVTLEATAMTVPRIGETAAKAMPALQPGAATAVATVGTPGASGAETGAVF